MDRIILHIDFDSFFASVEQQFNPKLRGVPIGVTATNGRSCIIASSREAKKIGIKTGTRSWEAKKICPAIILVPANFVKYLDVSKKFLNICKDYSPFIELFSIDEVFIDTTKTVHLFGGAYGIIDKIKQRIKNEIGEYITASFGISHNKLLAKLASGMKKPDGLFEIKKENIEQIYKNAKLTDVCGIGERVKIRLNKLGIDNLLQLGNTPLPLLIGEFGKCEAVFLKNIGLGFDSTSVISYTSAPVVKSVGRNYCLPKNEYNQKIILQNIYELCEEIGIKLRRLGKKARTVGISLRGNINIGQQKTFKEYLDSGGEIYEKCGLLFGKKLGKNNYVRQISVWVSNLGEKGNLPSSLFEAENKKEKVLSAVDRINERFGDHTIRNGFLLYADKLTTVPNGYMADKYERTKLALES